MKFTRLRLTGFKSFVEPSDVLIEPGLTGIVGPNGCGKSNLVEALQWVMGESSYKAMRASGMDEVIFSGSGARPARNTAEVSLTIDNSDRSAPTGFNDGDALEISRRIEREAGSSYRVNGREVRARDVQLLFADAAAGAHSPAMVGQGRVGQLIAAKPQARRAVLEGAAGITGLHGRRHDAELRLKAAEQNLERVEDVLAEIDRQLEALRRQARQAIRYRALSGEIRKAEATVLALRHRAAVEALREAEAALAEATALTNVRAEEQTKAARDQGVAAAAMPALRDRAAAAGAALQRLKLEEARIEGEERRVNARLDELGRHARQLGEDIARERRLIDENAAVLARIVEEEATLTASAEDHTAEEEAARTRQTAEDALAASEKLATEASATLAELSARRSQLTRALSEAVDRERRLADEAARVARERGELSGTETERRMATLAVSVETLKRQLMEAEAAAQGAETRAIEARGREAQARTGLADADAALARVETEMATLQALLAPDASDKPLIDAVEVKPGFEAALAAAFGDELTLSDDPEAPAHWRLVPMAEGDPTLPDGASPLGAVVDAPAVLARRLAQTGIVERADGPRLQLALKPGQRLVSREGDVWRWDGHTSGAEARRPEAERLAGRNRLAELGGRAEELRRVADRARGQMTESHEAALQTAQEEQAARAAWREAQKSLDRARTDLGLAEREHGRIATRLAALAEAEARVAAGREESTAARQAAEAALERLTDPATLEQPLADLRARVAADRAAVADARAAVAGFEREAAQRRERLQRLVADRAAWQQRQASAENHIANLANRQAEAEAERASLTDRPAALAAERRALSGTIETADRDRAAATDALAVAETELAAADKAAAAALQALSEAREQRGRAEERLAAAGQRTAEVAARIAEVLRCRPEEAAEAAGLGDGPAPALDQVEARTERLKQERERLGGVNLAAEQEAEELATRRTTIVADRDDLIGAIQKLRQGIASLNREGRERLLAAFTQVDERFRSLFTHLFGGGTAELQLTESDDPLEAGLEIIARPPGKKPQSITLLSGGEQALTALALIFAVFLTNPAPICVLDEVDAPLDDANVERFCALLEEMIRQTDTRFLVITHNPITMARMNRLYGVTMAERGVSQLVSVDLETAERFREAG
ncbi:MAG: AAA family ATPase [Bauldia sp.]|nr:AAA family ATPase [Bauldia sp.]